METVETRGLLVHARRRTGRIHPADARHSPARRVAAVSGDRASNLALSRIATDSQASVGSRARRKEGGEGERRGRRWLALGEREGREEGGSWEGASGGQSRSKGRESCECRNAEIPVISKPLLS